MRTFFRDARCFGFTREHGKYAEQPVAHFPGFVVGEIFVVVIFVDGFEFFDSFGGKHILLVSEYRRVNTWAYPQQRRPITTWGFGLKKP